MEMNSEYNFRLTICCNIDLNGGRLQFYLLIYAYKRTNHITTQFTLSLIEMPSDRNRRQMIWALRMKCEC